MRLKRVKLETQITKVPQSHSLKNIKSSHVIQLLLFMLCSIAMLMITLSALPVARINSEKGLNARQLTSAVWASTWCCALFLEELRVSQIINLLSSATEPKMCPCIRCQATSSTTEWWPVNTAIASRQRPSKGEPEMSQRQIVWSSDADSKCPSWVAFQERP